jgi:hypothetical protein
MLANGGLGKLETFHNVGTLATLNAEADTALSSPYRWASALHIPARATASTSPDPAPERVLVVFADCGGPGCNSPCMGLFSVGYPLSSVNDVISQSRICQAGLSLYLCEIITPA